MKKLFIVAILSTFLLFFTSCEMNMSTDNSDINQTLAISDTRFNGQFVYNYYWNSPSQDIIRKSYISYTFNGTNIAYWDTCFYYHYPLSGWTYSGSFIGDHYKWYESFEVNDGKYLTEFSNSWEDYEFSEDGNTLTLHNFSRASGNTLVLVKQ